jgi:predicted tellurium resistance membrane protein TerC
MNGVKLPGNKGIPIMLEQLFAIFTAQGLSSLVSLTALEIILGVDNLVVIALLVEHLPDLKREKARRIGLTLALVLRIILLLSISWVLGLTKPLLTVYGQEFSGKEILLLLGGLFLIYKATSGIHEMFTHDAESAAKNSKASLFATIAQIMAIDLVFSFDSVITAVGLTPNIPVIILAMTIAMVIMLVFTGYVSKFIYTYPSLKTLAMSFIMLIGVLLVGEGMGYHVPRSYVYFAMGFSCATEIINILIQQKKKD